MTSPRLEPGPRVQALSLWQPYASAIVYGHKRIETRSWSTPYRGRLAIHAAQNSIACIAAITEAKVDPHVLALWCDVFGIPHDLDRLRSKLNGLPRGAVIATCELVDVRRVESITFRDDDQKAQREKLLGDYSPGRFAWILRDVQVLRPFLKCRGAQRLFPVQL